MKPYIIHKGSSVYPIRGGSITECWATRPVKLNRDYSITNAYLRMVPRDCNIDLVGPKAAKHFRMVAFDTPRRNSDPNDIFYYFGFLVPA